MGNAVVLRGPGDWAARASPAIFILVIKTNPLPLGGGGECQALPAGGPDSPRGRQPWDPAAQRDGEAAEPGLARLGCPEETGSC